MFRILSKNRYYNEGLDQKYLNNNVSRSVGNEDLAWPQEHGTIRVGYLDDYPAYCDMDEESGELTGALKDYLQNAENCLYQVSLEFEPSPLRMLWICVQLYRMGKQTVSFRFIPTAIMRRNRISL